MEMSVFLSLGLLITSLLAYRANIATLALACLYWLVISLWSLGIIVPFEFSTTHWVDFININISYHIDGLSQLFTLLISSIGIIVLIYAWFYTNKSPQNRQKLLALLQLFAISMLGIVLADDMIMLFICWEMTSITSYLLIQFDVQDQSANQAAFNSLFVSVLGGLILLTGFILLNSLTGSWNISTVLATKETANLSIPFYLLLCGAITKSAQFPFYFWLTGAMKAPTPVSAYLHSATMVNAGIYLLGRFHPLFGDLDVWYPTLSTFGLITMTLSSILSLFQKDLKAILAYTTIFALGVMIYLLGGNTPLPIEAFAIFLLFHGIYKAGAFMLAGIIDKEYQTRDITKLTGIARHRLVLAVSTIIIFSAMAGIPPFFGFTVKEMIFEAKLASYSVSYVLMSISIFSSMLIAAASFRCLWYFFKPSKASKTSNSPAQKLTLIYLCPLLLIVLIVLFSSFNQYIALLIEPATQAILTANVFDQITPNTTASFLLSLMTSTGGVILCFLYFYTNIQLSDKLKWLELKSGFESIFGLMLAFGKQATRLTQEQPFINQLRIFFGAIFSMLLIFMIKQHIPLLTAIHIETPLAHTVVCALLLLTSVSLLLTSKFLYNLISLSLIGLTTSLFFIVNGAVDVVITQLLVEVLTIIILLIALRTVTITSSHEKTHDRIINGSIGLIAGCIVCYVLFSLNNIPFNQQLQWFYADNSFLVAHGKNIVNVILVDFRSLDTFGEAMVIVATAIGATLLLKKYANTKGE